MKEFKVKSLSQAGELRYCEMTFFDDDDTPDEVLKERIVEQIATTNGRVVSIERIEEESNVDG